MTRPELCLYRSIRYFLLPPLEKGDKGGFLIISVNIYDYKISPNPSLPKRGIFRE